MRASRIHISGPLTPRSRLTLSGDRAHYVGRVLRLRPGHELILFDGSGGEYPATVSRISEGAVDVDVGDRQPVERGSPLAVTLAIGISRGDRMDYTVQKTAELGLHALVPLLTERCGVRLSNERAGQRLQHWRRIALSASEQCGRNRLPVIQPVTDLQTWIAGRPPEPGFVLAPHGTDGIHELPHPGSRVTLLIGPEGGLSRDEVERATEAGLRALRLGPRVLRTETAAVAALATVQAIWGDLAR